MKQSQADWQLHFYGHVTHGFTFDKKDLPAPEIKYNKKAHERSQKNILYMHHKRVKKLWYYF